MDNSNGLENFLNSISNKVISDPIEYFRGSINNLSFPIIQSISIIDTLSILSNINKEFFESISRIEIIKKDFKLICLKKGGTVFVRLDHNSLDKKENQLIYYNDIEYSLFSKDIINVNKIHNPYNHSFFALISALYIINFEISDLLVRPLSERQQIIYNSSNYLNISKNRFIEIASSYEKYLGMV